MATTRSAGDEFQEIIGALRRQKPYRKGKLQMDDEPSGQVCESLGTVDVPIPSVKRLTRGIAAPIATVDVGLVKLGETTQGVIIALRGALVIDTDAGTTIRRYFSGPLFLDNSRKPEMLHALGRQLGQDDYYVELDCTDADSPHIADSPRLVRVRDGVADNARHYADRFRTWFERKIQADACTAIQNGTICFDSSLTLSTRDCPNIYLRGLISLAHDHGNSVIAVSKMSELEVMGKSVRWWLADAPPLPCYRHLTPLMVQESPARAQRILGQVYAMRFAAFSPTAFRVDVCAAPSLSDGEAITRFWSSTAVRGFYPDILVRAHMHATIPRSAVWSLQAQARRLYHVACRPEVSLRAAFGPHAGRFK